ncbi:MAG: bifunctional glutamate N-acetyltransferase/amino-acid acetyltransferase ArgJ [Oscillospiraceae bacterium]|jgi:glutamate N-acetyltransferase/amino-acid N-acetyltransferase|nr:bifunctional glutamate N-acetyltransferase/amino-acid acetyltransferase ArgJ [Oscillospiraceae bacterium]
MSVKWIDGGVTAPQGFRAAGIHVGVKTHNPDKRDLALIASDAECGAAAVFTKNIVKAAPVLVTREHLANGKLRAVIANSGNANACAPNGETNARNMCEAAAAALGISADDVAVASTGVIGQELPAEKITSAVPELARALSYDGSADAAAAIMTTDTVKKEFALEVQIGGKTVKIGGIAKGSGMIHPNMGTMLAFVTTDCAVSGGMLSALVKSAAGESFNRISVDGDTSTNDTCIVLANGLACNAEITEPGADCELLGDALRALCVRLATAMAADGEGATHLVTCTVSNAETEDKAETIAKSVISSSLVKAAFFGADANWGRILCAMGYSGADFDPERVDVAFRSAAGAVAVCASGRGLPFDEARAKTILTEHDVEVLIDLHEQTAPGECGECTCWGCDMTYDYVKINGDYRT